MTKRNKTLDLFQNVIIILYDKLSYRRKFMSKTINVEMIRGYLKENNLTKSGFC